MEQSQAILTIQRAWRNTGPRRKTYKYCRECNKLIFTSSNEGWFKSINCESCQKHINAVIYVNRLYRRGKGPRPKEQYIICYCGSYYCDWDCGVLDCGCIDICRGRCGTRPRHWRD